MRQVAALAGVGLKTVSRVVNGEPGVSPELTARVTEAIRLLDYRPDSTASSLRRADRRTATIGLLLEDVANPFSLVLSMALLLAWHGERTGAARFGEAASAIEGAVAEAIKTGRATKDVGGKLGTTATGEAVVELLKGGGSR